MVERSIPQDRPRAVTAPVPVRRPRHAGRGTPPRPATPVAEPATDDRVAAPRASRVLFAACGVALLAAGGAAAAEGGFAGSADDRTVEIVGATMNTGLGLVLAGVGLLLIVAALLRDGRLLGGLMAAALIAGGSFTVAATDDLLVDLRTGRSLGWALIVVGALVALASFLQWWQSPAERQEPGG